MNINNIEEELRLVLRDKRFKELKTFLYEL